MSSRNNTEDHDAGSKASSFSTEGFDSLWNISYEEADEVINAQQHKSSRTENDEIKDLKLDLKDRNFEIQKLRWQLSEREKELRNLYCEVDEILDLNRKLNKQLEQYQKFLEDSE